MRGDIDQPITARDHRSMTTARYNGSSMNNDGMTKDEEHKNTMCKDGRCPDINKKVQTGDGINNDVDTKTDGTTQ